MEIYIRRQTATVSEFKKRDRERIYVGITHYRVPALCQRYSMKIND